jgi:hypothetical protein
MNEARESRTAVESRTTSSTLLRTEKEVWRRSPPPAWALQLTVSDGRQRHAATLTEATDIWCAGRTVSPGILVPHARVTIFGERQHGGIRADRITVASE